jgi:hypothetical protein
MCGRRRITEFSETAPCQEARAVVALRAEVAAVRAAVGHHAAILEAVRGQVAAAVAAGARHRSINTGSMSETLEAA